MSRNCTIQRHIAELQEELAETNRGLVALKTNEGKVYLGWRLLAEQVRSLGVAAEVELKSGDVTTSIVTCVNAGCHERLFTCRLPGRLLFDPSLHTPPTFLGNARQQ